MNYKSNVMETTAVSDLPFFEYNKRQLYEISAQRNTERAQTAKPSGHFTHNGNGWVENEYEGFAVVSMLNDNEGNEHLFNRLVAIQGELKDNLQPSYGFYQLPSESFHQTVANTLSADRFKQNILHAGLEESYPAIVADAFGQIPATEQARPVRMHMAGLSVFGTAIGILGIFDNEDFYNRVTRFRSAFYGNEELAKLDVRMTRPFIGHITLAYVETNLNKNQKNHLAVVINEINETLLHEELYFNISKTGLRRYHHLAQFLKQDNYPVYQL